MNIRLAKLEDLETIQKIYRRAKAYMVETGNPNQWLDGYPTREMLEEDIACRHLYVMEEDGHLYGAFAFIIGDDDTYRIIEDGAWRSDATYGTIHRIASSGERKGLLHICMEYCLKQIDYIRIDTHHDNKVMQHLILKEGFVTCGIIYAIDGNPRIAYDYIK
jgi:hypothetical protein